MSEKVCVGCNQMFPESELYYGDRGMLCMTCMSDVEVKSQFAAGYEGAAWGALSFGLISWIFNPCLIATIGSIIAAVQVFRYPSMLDPEDRETVLQQKWVPVVAILGVLIALARFGLLIVVGALAQL